jgi:microsomal dipeptidase-like Zn-dependent dipeptidase
MQKYKILLISTLVIGITLCSVALAKNQSNIALNGSEHRANIANIVQTLIKVSDKEPGEVGDQVREMAREQNEAKERVAKAIDTIQDRNGLKTFLLGTDYKNVGEVRSEMVQTRNQIRKVEKLMDKTTNPTTKTTLQVQLTSLEAEQQKLETFLKTNESKFSLFGWFLKWFNRPTTTTTTSTSSSTTTTVSTTTTTAPTTTTTSTTL